MVQDDQASKFALHNAVIGGSLVTVRSTLEQDGGINDKDEYVGLSDGAGLTTGADTFTLGCR
jgi:hypothetical protein